MLFHDFKYVTIRETLNAIGKNEKNTISLVIDCSSADIKPSILASVANSDTSHP
jgi:hypothetical protein